MLTEFIFYAIIKVSKERRIKMLLIITLIIILVLFLICVTVLTLSDTQTFKAIDKKIAEKIDKRKT